MQSAVHACHSDGTGAGRFRGLFSALSGMLSRARLHLRAIANFPGSASTRYTLTGWQHDAEIHQIHLINSNSITLADSDASNSCVQDLDRECHPSSPSLTTFHPGKSAGMRHDLTFAQPWARMQSGEGFRSDLPGCRVKSHPAASNACPVWV